MKITSKAQCHTANLCVRFPIKDRFAPKADPDAIYNLCLIFKKCYKDFMYNCNITLFGSAFVYICI